MNEAVAGTGAVTNVALSTVDASPAGQNLIVSAGGNVANQLSSWTSTTNGTTFGAGLYTRPTDNDAALLDLLWGSTGNDDFSSTAGETQDKNSPWMGSDESF